MGWQDDQRYYRDLDWIKKALAGMARTLDIVATSQKEVRKDVKDLSQTVTNLGTELTALGNNQTGCCNALTAQLNTLQADLTQVETDVSRLVKYFIPPPAVGFVVTTEIVTNEPTDPVAFDVTEENQ
jgi:uncharacterized protein (DUF3084 family)